jgi:hypothetical protein
MEITDHATESLTAVVVGGGPSPLPKNTPLGTGLNRGFQTGNFPWVSERC